MIAPYKHPPKPKGVALMMSPDEVVTEDGEARAMDRWSPEALTVYADREVATAYVAQGHGALVTWNGKAIRWVPSFEDPRKAGPHARGVTLLKDILPPGPAEALGALATWGAWVRKAGGVPRSIGSTSESILRATLARPLWLSCGTPPPLTAHVGGRVESTKPPGSYMGPLVLWDLQAAYGATLARTRYGGAWYERPSGDRGIPAGVAGPMFAHARVSLPGGMLGPLVRRPRSDRQVNRRAWEAAFDFNGDLHAHMYPRAGRITGVWTAAELEAARDGGARVRVNRVWYHAAEGFPFIRWWSKIEEGRTLPGPAAIMAKAVGNSLWGRFNITPGNRQVVRAVGGSLVPTPYPLPGGGRVRAVDLAEHVTGSVRGRLFRVMTEAGDRLMAAHTDGAWVYGDDQDWHPSDPGWRMKEIADVMDYLGPSGLCFTRPGEETPRYRMPGVPLWRQPVVFQEAWKGLRGGRPLAHRWPVPGSS